MENRMKKDPRWIPEEEFDAIYTRVPRLTVELLVRTPKGVALTKRSIEPCKGQWHLPGGTVYFGETLIGAAKRVAMNELGVEINIGKQVGYLEYPLMNKAGYKGWPVGVEFEVTIVSGDITGSHQGEEVGFFNEIPPNTVADQAKFLVDLM